MKDLRRREVYYGRRRSYRITRSPSAQSLGDARVTLGRRHGESLQSVLSLTLPTATGGYGRGVP